MAVGKGVGAFLVGTTCLALSVSAQTQLSHAERQANRRRVEAARAMAMPKVNDAFTISPFVWAPDIHSPASIAVSPAGDVYVGVDEYNTQPSREIGLGMIKRCVDTDKDGVADRITVFAEKINSPQGMTFVGDTLYVSHAPLFTAFRDTDGDGVADLRDDLISGLGPVPEGLVHHVPSGPCMGIDGLLYISIGDKGIVKATGKDGRTVTLLGGGIVRVQPDGTEMELYCSGTRNTYDVAMDPFLNVFTRDNTNDGNGWGSRVTQMQRGANYGYPNLFKHYADELIPPLADYGGGSATGSVYIHEPGLPGGFGNSLYAIDWAVSKVFRHELKPAGATFTILADVFKEPGFDTDIDVDANGRIFLADWDRRNWGNSGPVGKVFLIRASNATPQLPMPDLKRATMAQLLDVLSGYSLVRAREAQHEIVRRKNPFGLTKIMQNRHATLQARVAALFTLVRIDPMAARPAMLETLANDPDLREYAIRALADHDEVIRTIDPSVFVSALTDPNPRVREQATIAGGRVGNDALAAALISSTADQEVTVRHAAIQSLRRLNAVDACGEALARGADPEIARGVLRALRGIHEAKAVAILSRYLETEKDGALRGEAARTLGRLYQQEAPFDGSWWTPHPDTLRPYYKAVNWSHSADVGALLARMVSDDDPAAATVAIAEAGRCQVRQAVPALASLVNSANPLRVDAARAIVDLNGGSPEALAALETIIHDQAFPADLRTSAAQALGSAEGLDALATIVRLLDKFDAEAKQGEALIEKVGEALGARPVPAEGVSLIIPLLSAKQKPVRVAAAVALLKSDAQPAKDATAAAWNSDAPEQLEAMLLALPKVKPDAAKPYEEWIRAAIKSNHLPVRQAAIAAIGHLADALSVPELVKLADRSADREVVIAALAQIGPDKTPDEQVLAVAKLLAETAAATAIIGERDVYARTLAAAQKFAADKRVPAEQSSALTSQLRQSGVISTFQQTDPIPGPDADRNFATKFPPEETPAGPFAAFTVNGQPFDWKPVTLADPNGLHHLAPPDKTVIYATAIYDAPAAGNVLLSLGSDDGIKAWVNGTIVHENNADRGLRPDVDRVAVPVVAGSNVLLFKVNNRAGVAGLQARIRSRVAEFEQKELGAALNTMKGDASRGKLVFESVGCSKCHTTASHDEPRGPFLGDAGKRFERKHLLEAILKPAAKIAQGFASERIVTRSSAGDTETIGFITRESGDEVQLRDLTGKVTIVKKADITSRTPMAGSMMPEGLADAMTLDDLASLLHFLSTLKGSESGTVTATR
ncbi:MAG TPA: HEAT repeat domain-containing protein [Tepidisphaeraceae bacterium]|nr:HEAT repeat domain-containing protein [Tepidisphaeraceae bacterium]